MREFNTSVQCDPEIHYTLIRKDHIAKNKEHVKKGRFFTIFAPRQTGKTTYFRILLQQLTDTHIAYQTFSYSFCQLTHFKKRKILSCSSFLHIRVFK